MSFWGGRNRKAEAEVRKAGGIRVPLSAGNRIGEIIKIAFNNMQERISRHNIVMDELFLEEISIFEVRLSTHLGFVVDELRDKTKNYKVLFKDDAKKTMQDEIKEAFDNLATLAVEPDTPMEKKAMRALRMLEDEVRTNIVFYVNKWKY